MYIHVHYKDEKDNRYRCCIQVKDMSFDDTCRKIVNDGFFYHRYDMPIYVPGHRVMIIKKACINENDECVKCDQKGDKCQNQGKENQEPVS